MNKIYKIEDIPNHISGIYKINFPNGKSYIGLSNNIKRRIKEHNAHSKQEKGSPTKHAVHYAIEKYYQGSIPEIEVLEEIDFNDKDKMKEREKYWIAYYDTYGENGYNLTEGGDGLEMLRNLWKENQKLTDEQAKEVRDLLRNSFLTQREIAEKFGVEESIIKYINNGISYYLPELNYPIREKYLGSKLKSVRNNNYNLVTPEILKEIHEKLLNTDLTYEEIAKEFNINPRLMSTINIGKYDYYKLDGYSYPLRDKAILKISGFDSIHAKLTRDEVIEIISLLKDSDMMIKDIADKYGVSRNTISKVNQGNTYFIEEVDYPIREVNEVNKLSDKEEAIDKIYDLLKNSKLSMTEIGEKFNIGQQTVSDINLGKYHKREGIKYPIRSNEIPEETINKVIEMLKNNCSYAEIGRTVNLDSRTVKKIDMGTTYKRDNEIYPIKKKKALSQEEIDELIRLLEETRLSYAEIGKRMNMDRHKVSKIDKGSIRIRSGLSYPIRKIN